MTMEMIYPMCAVCGRMDVVLMKHKIKESIVFKDKDILIELRCSRCVNEKTLDVGDPLTGQTSDVYNVKWKLRDNDGKEWIEEYEGSLQDFEIEYGNNNNAIVWLSVRMHNRAMI